MKAHTCARTARRWISIALGAIVGGYVAYAGVTWFRYGHPSAPSAEDKDDALDRFMPMYDVVERHRIAVRAPAATTFAAACEVDLEQSPLARAIFGARELLMRGKPETETRPRGLIALTRSLGWAVLAEVPGRQIVMGAVTRPWEANVVFRPVAPEKFEAFREPGYVKIVWTLRADSVGPAGSVFRTETRALATDDVARTRFRRYWSLLSPGIILIRLATLLPVKADAERLAREAATRNRACRGGGS